MTIKKEGAVGRLDVMHYVYGTHACNLFNTPPPALLPCPLPVALGLFRATLLFLLLRLLEHGQIAFHALAFFGTPSLHHLSPSRCWMFSVETGV